MIDHGALQTEVKAALGVGVETGPFVRLADLPERDVAWLWPGRIAWGNIVLLAGDGAVGKSTLAQHIAAAVTRGEAIDGGEARDGSVMILTAEEDPSVVIRPRMRLMGADLARVTVLNPDEATLTFPSGVDRLEERCAADGVRFLVIDTGPAFMDAGLASNTEEDIRRMLRPLGQMAARLEMAVVLLAHLNKQAGASAGHRVMGGAAWRNAARQVLLVGAPPQLDPRETGDRVLVVEKNNLGVYPPAQAFALVSSAEDPSRAVIRWGEEVQGVRADDLVRVLSSEDQTARTEATKFLLAALADGSRLTKALKQEAAEAGVAWRTVERAKRDLQVAARKDAEGWAWSLPAKAAIKTATQKPGGLGGLGGLESDEERWEALAS